MPGGASGAPKVKRRRGEVGAAAWVNCSTNVLNYKRGFEEKEGAAGTHAPTARVLGGAEVGGVGRTLGTRTFVSVDAIITTWYINSNPPGDSISSPPPT
jgi:hypothetical protein